MRLLAGDIGGTKTELVLYEGAPDHWEVREHRRVPSQEHASLEEVLARFPTGGELDGAAFGVAGPVRDGRCHTTNLPWQLDTATLTDTLGCPVTLLNDFEAVVRGVGELDDADLRVLQAGERHAAGPIAVLGAGTGLGTGIGVPTLAGLVAIAGEGGHRHLAPRNALEDRVLQHLRTKLGGRVSVERVVSGPGLAALYEFVIATELEREDPTVARELRAGDPSAVIGLRGQAGSDAACARALDLFVGFYGAEAGDLALTVLPTGGLYIAGGIAPKLLERLERGDFMQALLDKGRMGEVLTRIPVAIITQPRVGLLGARVAAANPAHSG
ncbi:MAG: glucokinase [Myxococcales bacterium]|nr:glucokinase [Myxococcales bacterium]